MGYWEFLKWTHSCPQRDIWLTKEDQKRILKEALAVGGYVTYEHIVHTLHFYSCICEK